jgi:4-hydroxyphenylacetate 3-monooxygenase
MLRTGREYLAGLQDGRVVYQGAERIRDVVSHPGFRRAAETIATIYDLKFDSAHRADMVVEEGDGAPYTTYFLMPRTREDLEKRLRCHKLIADATYGLFGRSPDHVAGLITGLAMEAGALDQPAGRAFSGALLEYYRDARERDAYAVYAVLPGRASCGRATGKGTAGPTLRVVREGDDGVVLRGVKALATAAMLADEIWIGNLQPISGEQELEAITCVVPCHAPGLELWSRRTFATSATNEFDSPLTWRFDEGDAVVVCDDVKVDWNRVFVHRDPVRSSEIYIRTPAHCLANHQSAVRSRSKVRLLVGLASRIARETGAAGIAGVNEVLGRLAALEATLAGLVDAQVYQFDRWPSGGVCPARRYVYAALNWCQEFFPVLIEAVRELSGCGVFRFPANTDVEIAPGTRATFERFWGGARGPAMEQMQLFKLGWDLIGSEFAGRQQQYERFYAGPPFVVRGHSYREAPWDELDLIVTQLMARCRVSSTAGLPPADAAGSIDRRESQG